MQGERNMQSRERFDFTVERTRALSIPRRIRKMSLRFNAWGYLIAISMKSCSSDEKPLKSLIVSESKSKFNLSSSPVNCDKRQRTATNSKSHKSLTNNKHLSTVPVSYRKIEHQILFSFLCLDRKIFAKISSLFLTRLLSSLETVFVAQYLMSLWTQQLNHC